MPLLRSTARQLANFLFRQFQELEKQCLYYGPLLDNLPTFSLDSAKS